MYLKNRQPLWNSASGDRIKFMQARLSVAENILWPHKRKGSL